ncbi:hypothetical protein LTR17_009160 [Elasticomyces elasticus]|nr:hypothetical protein LTR17_009160 [Elasticomyces elasticus]
MSVVPYQALNASRMEIRVLDLLPGRYRSPIRCRLRTVSIADKDDLPYYAGLSYTWGAPLPSKTVSVSVNGKDYSVEIGLNLFRALQGLRSGRKEDTIWVDALCIDQADNDERASQVSFMGEVYARASTVYIWLGTTAPADSSRHELASVCRMMQNFSFFASHTPKGLMDFASRLPSAVVQRWRYIGGFDSINIELFYFKAYRNVLFMELSATPYRIEKALRNSTPCWTNRAWVLQEFALSSSTQICFDRTKLVYECYRSHDFGVSVPEVCHGSYNLSNLLLTLCLPRRDGVDMFKPPATGNPRPLQGILRLVRRSAKCRTSNLHDKVFAFLGLVREEEAREIAVNYNNPFWVTCARATYASAKHNRDEGKSPDARYARLSVLECASWADDRPPSFPSWVADFSRITSSNPYDEFRTSSGWPGSEDRYDVSISPDLRCLTTYGVIFGSVAASFTLYGQLDEDNSTEAQFDDGYSAKYSWLTTGTSVPAVQATLLAELTSLALQNRGPVAAGALDNSKLQAEKLSSLVSQLEKQQEYRCIPGDEVVSGMYPFGYIHSIRLFASSNGYVGFAPGDVEPGDTIVFLRGAEWPAVLRQYEDRWVFREFIYVCGVMQGELKDGDGLQEWKVEPFVLC